MVKKVVKDGYTIEYPDTVNYNEAEIQEMIDKSIRLVKHKEAKDSCKQEDSPEPRLIHADGKLVEKGDEVVDFRGNKAIVKGWQAPAFEGKSGRVYVEELLEEGKKFEAGYYPEVYGLKWKGLPWQEEEVEDIKVEDIPVNAPEENVSITYTEKLKGGKNALTYGMIEEAYKQRHNDEGKTFAAYIDVAMESLKDDIANAKYIVSGEMKNTRRLLLEDYIKIENLIKKAGMEEKLAEFKPLVDELSEKLSLNYFKQPKFKKSEMKSAAKELRNKHRFDSEESKEKLYEIKAFHYARGRWFTTGSNLTLEEGLKAYEEELQALARFNQNTSFKEEVIVELKEQGSENIIKSAVVKRSGRIVNDSIIQKSLKPVFLCSKSDLTASYNDAKQGKLPQVFEGNLKKVEKDMEADYERINQGRDHYLEDPRVVKLLPEIIDLYELATKYAEDLGYKDIATRFAYMLTTIKKGWALD